jgi:hypothetical protein
MDLHQRATRRLAQRIDGEQPPRRLVAGCDRQLRCEEFR